MNDKVVYPAILEFADGVIGVSFPDLPGCVTAAETEKEAIELGREAMVFHLEGMIEDGEQIPAASSLRSVKAGKNCAVVLIDGPRPDKPERFNVSAQSSQLMLIDKLAHQNGMTRSAWIVARSSDTREFNPRDMWWKPADRKGGQTRDAYMGAGDAGSGKSTNRGKGKPTRT